MTNEDVDYQTESLRVWKGTDEDKQKIEESHPISIYHKGLKLYLVGFTKVFEPKTNRLAFAYKFKEEQKVILFYDVTGIRNHKIEEAKEFIKQYAKDTGYTILDSSEYVKNIYNEKHNLLRL